MTYQSQVLAFGGAPARQAVYALLALDGVDCRNLNRNCYGLVEVSGGVGTLNLASKDQNGAVVVDPTTLGACALSQGSP